MLMWQPQKRTCIEIHVTALFFRLKIRIELTIWIRYAILWYKPSSVIRKQRMVKNLNIIDKQKWCQICEKLVNLLL